MPNSKTSIRLSRRDFLKLAGGALAVAAGSPLLSRLGRQNSIPARGFELLGAGPALAAPNAAVNLHLAATDGWIYFPGAVPPYHPDPWAPAPFTTYAFGFRDVTGLSDALVNLQRNKVQASAPILWVNQEDDVYLKLTNLGLA